MASVWKSVQIEVLCILALRKGFEESCLSVAQTAQDELHAEVECFGFRAFKKLYNME